MFGCVPHWAGTGHVLHGSLFTDGITPLQHCSTAVGGGATIRGGKLQWWVGVGCSVRHGALFRDEIMGWPGPGSRVWVAATVPIPAPVPVSCTVTRVSAPTTYTELCLQVKCRFRQTHAGWHILQCSGNWAQMDGRKMLGRSFICIPSRFQVLLVPFKSNTIWLMVI